MDFALDEMQTMIKDSVARWAEKEYDFEKRRKLAAESGFSEDHWRLFAEMGWLGAGLSEEDGGLGGGAEEAAILAEEFGKVLLLEPYLAVAVLATQCLLGTGNDAARALVPEIAAGETRVVLAHEEVRAMGVLSHVATTASTDGAINGVKTLVIGAPFAAKLIVSARTGGDTRDTNGIALYLVDVDAPGVEKRDYRLSDGQRASEITFKGAKGELIAVDGFPALDRAYAHAIVILAAEAVGAMERAMWITRDYLKTRKQFGRTLNEFQALQHRMADILIELELARSALYKALGQLDADPAERRLVLAALKVQLGKSTRFVGAQAIQLHGGIGVTEEYSIGHYFKRLILVDSQFGTSAQHQKLLAKAIQAGL
jgi:alkylation response protein AidB-like acyl-CoA dehydrogenase